MENVRKNMAAVDGHDLQQPPEQLQEELEMLLQHASCLNEAGVDHLVRGELTLALKDFEMALKLALHFSSKEEQQLHTTRDETSTTTPLPRSTHTSGPMSCEEGSNTNHHAATVSLSSMPLPSLSHPWISHQEESASTAPVAMLLNDEVEENSNRYGADDGFYNHVLLLQCSSKLGDSLDVVVCFCGVVFFNLAHTFQRRATARRNPRLFIQALSLYNKAQDLILSQDHSTSTSCCCNAILIAILTNKTHILTYHLRFHQEETRDDVFHLLVQVMMYTNDRPPAFDEERLIAGFGLSALCSEFSKHSPAA